MTHEHAFYSPPLIGVKTVTFYRSRLAHADKRRRQVYDTLGVLVFVVRASVLAR